MIHLACISNDPSFELNPSLGKSINLDSFFPFLDICKKIKLKNLYMHHLQVYMELKISKMLMRRKS